MINVITDRKNLASNAVQHLLDFARADLEDLRPDSLKTVRRAIAVIVRQAGHYSQRRRLVRTNLKVWKLEIERNLPWGDARERTRTVNQLTELQATLNGCLNALFPPSGFGDVPGGSTELPVRAKRLHVQRQNAGAGAPVEVRFVAEGWKDAFWLATAALLEEFGSKLRRCPVCAAAYFKVRRQAYCSLQCSQTKRSRTYYRGHRKEILKQRRKARLREQGTPRNKTR